MTKKKNKKNLISSFLTSTWVFVFILVLLLVFSVSLIREVMRKIEIQRQIAALEEKIDSLENDNKQLESLIAYLQTDDFIEEEARKKLSLKKPGEKVIAVPELEESSDSSNASTSTLPNWRLWWYYFFSNNY